LKNNKSKPIRLVHIISSLKIGGAENVLVSLVDRLHKNGFEQHVIYFYDGPHAKRICELGVPVYQVKGVLSLYDPIFFLRLFLLLKKIKPDCLHTLLWAANFAGRLLSFVMRVPLICGLHNVSELNGRIRTMLDRFIVAIPSSYIAISDGVKKSFCQYWQNKDVPPVHVIRNGIDIGEKNNFVTREQLGLTNDNFVIGSVGRFVSVKNYDLIIEQVALLHGKYSHVRLLLIGTGPQEGELRQRAKDLGVSNETIFITGKNAISYYPLFDCFVLASYVEDHPLVLLEAMHFGLPCIVSSNDAQHPVITSGVNGIVVTPDQSFAQLIPTLIEEPDLVKSLGNKALSTVKKEFSIENMISNYSKLFSKLNKI